MSMNNIGRRPRPAVMIPALLALCLVSGHALTQRTDKPAPDAEAIVTISAQRSNVDEQGRSGNEDLLMLVAAELSGEVPDIGRSETVAAAPTPSKLDSVANCPALLSYRLRPLMGPTEQALCESHAGKVLLVVNTASRCGFTPQFAALESLSQRYGQQGFEVLGFPSDDFRQEPGSEAEVAEFCELNYGVTFPMYQKVHVRGGDAHPFYRDLAETTGQSPRWNFNKYLIDRQGTVVQHYDSAVKPLGDQLVNAIEALL